jgi:hypothetical protein
MAICQDPLPRIVFYAPHRACCWTSISASQNFVNPKGFQDHIGGRSWPSNAVEYSSRYSSSRRINSPLISPIGEVKVCCIPVQAETGRSRAAVPARISRRINVAEPVSKAPSQRIPGRRSRFERKVANDHPFAEGVVVLRTANVGFNEALKRLLQLAKSSLSS